MKYTVVLDPRAFEEIEQTQKYYDSQREGLGKKFYDTLSKHIRVLEMNPFFRVRYDSIRCLPMKVFPFMIHYSIHEEVSTVVIHAVLHTSRDPKGWNTKNINK